MQTPDAIRPRVAIDGVYQPGSFVTTECAWESCSEDYIAPCLKTAPLMAALHRKKSFMLEVHMLCYQLAFSPVIAV